MSDDPTTPAPDLEALERLLEQAATWMLPMEVGEITQPWIWTIRVGVADEPPVEKREAGKQLMVRLLNAAPVLLAAARENAALRAEVARLTKALAEREADDEQVRMEAHRWR